eukprot:COSAG06_NODE_48061_length_334_cov_38.485106_1_plen_67_part_10
MRFSFAGRVDRSIFADPFVERTYTSADVAQEEVRAVPSTLRPCAFAMVFCTRQDKTRQEKTRQDDSI